MIARVWHGWTKPENANTYEHLLRNEILPGIHRVAGYRGAYVLRSDGKDKDEVAFITITLFDSLDAVRAFAGEDYEKAVILPKAHKLLSRFDARSQHYQAVLQP